MEDVSNKLNLRVICRLKPDENEDESKQSNNKNSNLRTKHNNETHTISIYPSRGGRKPLQFTFDRILGPQTTQENTFDVVAKSVIQDVLNGFNSTIFCYGQTTSGKTHTIFGKEGSSDPTMIGLLPRCVAYCIHCIKESRDVIEASITISCIEIYQEQLKDLISPERSSKLKICLSPNGDTYVENLTQTFMQSANDALKMVEVIKLNRTKQAKNSSFSSHRSHCLACLTIKQKLSNNHSRKAKCYFGDLAGSEVSTDAMIKKDASLNVLRLVIHSLSAKKHSIPYHNSALTTILCDSLGGNTKTTVIITCCMSLLKRDETINSLRFGQRARLIENNLKMNKELSRHDMKRIMEQQTHLIASLQLQLRNDRLSTSRESHSIDTVPKAPSVSDNEYDSVCHELKELRGKYDKLLQERSVDRVRKLAMEEKCQDLESNCDDIEKKYTNMERELNALSALSETQKNEIQSLNQNIANAMADNDLRQKRNEDLSEKNTQLQAISNTILNQLETLEKELEIQQDQIRHLQTKSRSSVHTDHRRQSSMESTDNGALSPPSNDDMARGSVIIHKFISLPLSTTTPSTSPNGNSNGALGFGDIKTEELKDNMSGNESNSNESNLKNITQSHTKIKQSLYNLRELLEANFIASARKKESSDSKKVTKELISQYNNVMEQYMKLQLDYNEAQKSLSERQNEIMILKKEKEELQSKNENLIYETERIKAEYKQRKDDMEKSIDQTKINQLRSYLDNKFTNTSNNNTLVLSAEALSASPHSPSNSGILILGNNASDNLIHQHSRDSSTSSTSKSHPHLDDYVGSAHSTHSTLDSSYGSPNPLNTSSLSPNLALYSQKSRGKLATVPEAKKQDEWRKGLQQRFELIDTDKDGLISLDDFIKFTKQKNPNSSEDQIKKIFHQMDTQNKGKVTWNEFEKCFRRFAMKNMALKRLQIAGNRLEQSHSTPFDEREEFSKLGTKGKLHAIRVWYDNIIYGFKCTWIRKSSSAPNKIKQIIGTTHLPDSLKQSEVTEDVFMLRPDEYISCVTVWIGNDKNCVYGITFETTQNRWHEFGGGMGTPILLQPPDKHGIHAFYGGVNESGLNYIGAYALPRKDYHKSNRDRRHSRQRRRSSTSKSFSKSKSKSKSQSQSQSKSKSRSHLRAGNSASPVGSQKKYSKDIDSKGQKKYSHTQKHMQSESTPVDNLSANNKSPNLNKAVSYNNVSETKENSENNSEIVTRGQSHSVPAPNTSFIDVHDNSTNNNQIMQEKHLNIQIQPPSPNEKDNSKKKKKSGKFLWWSKK